MAASSTGMFVDFASAGWCDCVEDPLSGMAGRYLCLTGVNYMNRTLFKIKVQDVDTQVFDLYRAAYLDLRKANGSSASLEVPLPDPTSPVHLRGNFSTLFALPGNSYGEVVPAVQFTLGEALLGYVPVEFLERNLGSVLRQPCSQRLISTSEVSA